MESLNQQNGQLPSVYGYTCFQQFLKDAYQYKKSLNPKFSYNVWARQAGLKSSSVIKMLMSGQRMLSGDNARKLVTPLGLSEVEYNSFCILVSLNKAKSDSERQRLEKAFRNAYSGAEIAKPQLEKFRFLKKWFYLPLLEILKLSEFKPSLASIQERLRFKVGKDDIDEAYKVLSQYGLVEFEKDGIKPKHELCSIEVETPSVEIRQHHVNMMKLAMHAAREGQKEEHEFGSVTLSMRQEDMETVRKLAIEFQEKVLQLTCKKKDPNAVFQLNVQLFPLTKEPK